MIRKVVASAASAAALVVAAALALADQFADFYQVECTQTTRTLCVVAPSSGAGVQCQIFGDGAHAATFTMAPGANLVTIPQTWAITYEAIAPGFDRGVIQPGNPGIN